MTQDFSVLGMTCESCVTKVSDHLKLLEGAERVTVNLKDNKATITANRVFTIAEIQTKLPKKYTVTDPVSNSLGMEDRLSATSKWRQLRPLFLIFGYLVGGTILMNYAEWNTKDAMLDFMGLFYIVFSFFKFLDLKGFAHSFRMYDPIAKHLSAYSWVYPFLELGLGLMFLIQFQITVALGITLLVLGSTTVGVTKILLDKRTIRCACLGTTLNLPMTEATFIENAIMLTMALLMLV